MSGCSGVRTVRVLEFHCVTIQPDITLKCSEGTACGTNTGTLTIMSNALSFSTNALITGTLGV